MKLEHYCHQNLLPMCNPHLCFNLDLFDCGVEREQVRNDVFFLPIFSIFISTPRALIICSDIRLSTIYLM